mmetsp:Transcript_18200/g.42351  ORF Transcript_18200/g.42351 Transcript_18200/m.42351 type:complete len:370 (+) Transcript_18200:93-1202(+)
MLRPSATCCGCASLLVGVEVICLLTLIAQISTIALCSSDEPMYVASIRVPPFVQVLLASWAFAGIPLVILAGVGALYRIESNLRIFVVWLLISLLVEVAVPIWFLVSGQLCGALVSQQVQRLGNAMACTFTDTFVFFWTLIAAIVHLYMVYVVWSAAEEIGASPYPELLKYADKLASYQEPRAPEGPYPVNERAVPSKPVQFAPVQTQAPPPAPRPMAPSRPAPLPPPTSMPVESARPLPVTASYVASAAPPRDGGYPVEVSTSASRVPMASAVIPCASARIPMASAEIPMASAQVPIGSSAIPMASARIPMASSEIPLGSTRAVPTAGVPSGSMASRSDLQSFMPFPTSGVDFGGASGRRSSAVERLD